jgi:hypothetical protein
VAIELADGAQFSQKVDVSAWLSWQPAVYRHDEQVRAVVEDLDQHRLGPPRAPAGRGRHDRPSVPQSCDPAAVRRYSQTPTPTDLESTSFSMRVFNLSVSPRPASR